MVTLSHAGYAKRQPVTAYRAQKRGGKGRCGDGGQGRGFHRAPVGGQHPRHAADLHQRRPRVLAQVYQLPDAGPNSRGRPIINWIPLEAGEKVQAVLPVREFSEDQFVFFATRDGTVKKTPLTDYSRPR